MPPAHRPKLRHGGPADAATVAALATQVFLDTYATEGVRPDLAREAFDTYSEPAFSARLAEPQRTFLLAEHGAGLMGFAEVLCTAAVAPGGVVTGAELVRLYIQPRFQRNGLGRRLIAEAETLARMRGLGALWLTVWEGNADALAFYARTGYADLGPATYSFGGHTYGNRVVARHWG